MKPRIRKHRGFFDMGQYWLCLSQTVHGDSWYKGGVGKSPDEAYADWARQNHVD